MIAVAGAIGGVGTTSIAVNLGCILAQNPQNSVALIDLDLCLGDADVFLDTIPDYTLVDVAQNVTRLDFTLLKRSLTKHSSGLYLLPRPVQLEDMSLITPDDLQRVIGLLKATFTHLVLDLSKGYTAIDLVALEMANEILLVTQLDLPCLRNVVRLVMSFGNMEGLADKVKIIVNRVGLESGQITLKKAEETIGKEVFWQLPNDYRTMIDARNNGVPLIDSAPKAAITQSFIALAKALSGETDAAAAAAPGKNRLGGSVQDVAEQGREVDASTSRHPCGRSIPPIRGKRIAGVRLAAASSARFAHNRRPARHLCGTIACRNRHARRPRRRKLSFAGAISLPIDNTTYAPMAKLTTTLRTADPKESSFEELKQRIHGKLVDKLDLSRVGELEGDTLRREIRLVVEHLCDSEDTLLNRNERERLVSEVLDETFGLGPLEMLLKDPTISDILINGPKNIYCERRGKMEKTNVVFRDNNHLMQIIDRIISQVGRRVDETCPMVDARMIDGSRFNAIIPPLALDGACVSIRRFGANPLKLEDLLNFKAFTPEMVMLLEGAIKARLNIIISGGTGSGKTTLLNTLSSFIPNTDRIVTIEDAAELQLQQDHVVRLETRPANIEGKGAISATDLVKNALRMRPERIIIGECRGAESLDMLQAMNTGHEGSMTTLHANNPRDALSRLETMIMMAGFELPLKAMRTQIASAIDLVVQASRLQGGARKVTAITEIVGMEQDTVVMQDVYRYDKDGVDENGRAYGKFVATGIRPTFMSRLEQAGVRLPSSAFRERVMLED